MSSSWFHALASFETFVHCLPVSRTLSRCQPSLRSYHVNRCIETAGVIGKVVQQTTCISIILRRVLDNFNEETLTTTHCLDWLHVFPSSLKLRTIRHSSNVFEDTCASLSHQLRNLKHLMRVLNDCSWSEVQQSISLVRRACLLELTGVSSVSEWLVWVRYVTRYSTGCGELHSRGATYTVRKDRFWN